MILVTDDEKFTRTAVREALEAFGFATAEAETGPQAMARVEQLHPDLVLLDVVMPGDDGFTVCRALREQTTTRDLPIVMMTASQDDESIHQAFLAGATDFITKPVDLTLLGYRLRYLLRASGDLASMRDSQRQLSESQRLAQLGSWEWQPGSREIRFSPECARLFAIDEQTITENLLLSRVVPEDRSRLAEALSAARDEGTAFSLDHWIRLPDGTLRYLHSQGQVASVSNAGQFVLTGTCQDVTERRRVEEKIHHLAHYDPLTGLPNRLLFNEQLAYIIAYARRRRHQLALLFLDIDRFKAINDSFGHRTGDDLLRRVAERLKMTLRKTDFVARQVRDEFPQTVARLGGDEFSIWLPDIHEIQDVLKVLRRLKEIFREPFLLGDQEVFVSTSIGIALYPQDGADVETLLKNADTAMHHAKNEGRDTYRFYAGAMNSAARRLLTMEANLHRALEREELILHFQPQIELASGRICGAETLLRWHHQGKDLIMPNEFIPLAEESGLIDRLGEWTIRSACEQARRWQEEGLAPLQLSVNLSSRQFWKEHLTASVARSLAQTGLEPRWLHLEITESILMQNRAGTIATLQFLKELGVGIALDDFGTGYSSLSYLKQFPLDGLKIDQSFVHDLHHGRQSILIVRAIIALAHGLGLRVIAEGVENPQQLDRLRREGCDLVQGFLISRPLPAAEFADFLRNWQPEMLPSPPPRGALDSPAPLSPI